MTQHLPKSKNYLLSGIKQLVSYSSKNKRAFFIIWDDETGVRHYGSPTLVDKFKDSLNCKECSERTWDEAAKADSIKIAKNDHTFDFDGNATKEEICKAIYETAKTETPCLPCQ